MKRYKITFDLIQADVISQTKQIDSEIKVDSESKVSALCFHDVISYEPMLDVGYWKLTGVGGRERYIREENVRMVTIEEETTDEECNK